MADGMPSHLGDIGSESIKDASLSAADLASNSVTTAKIASEAVTSPKAAIIATGSPTVYGNSVQYGSDTAAGEAKWVVFGTAFKAAPQVSLTPEFSGAAAGLHAYVATRAVGSFSWVGIPSGTNSTFSWVAIGSL